MGLLIPYPVQSPRAVQRNYSGRPTLTWGTTLTASATPHTEGANTQIIAATTHDAQGIWLSFKGMHISATQTDGLVNIKLGASYTQTLIPNLLVGWAANGDVAGPRRYYFPLYIPRGTQIGGSLRALIASDVVRCEVELEPLTGERWAGLGVECLGAVTGSSRGTLVTPGTTSDGAWASIGTSTKPYKAVMLSGSGGDTSTIAQYQAADIGVGSALIDGLENFRWTTSVTEWVSPVDTDAPRYVQVPSGSALQARVQSHSTDVESRFLCIYGVY